MVSAGTLGMRSLVLKISTSSLLMAHQSIPMCKQSKANTNIKDLFLGGIAQLILDVKTIREYLVPKVRLTRKK